MNGPVHLIDLEDINCNYCHTKQKFEINELNCTSSYFVLPKYFNIKDTSLVPLKNSYFQQIDFIILPAFSPSYNFESSRII